MESSTLASRKRQIFQALACEMNICTEVSFLKFFMSEWTRLLSKRTLAGGSECGFFLNSQL